MNAAKNASGKLLLSAWIGLVAIEVVTQLAFRFSGRHTGAFDFSPHAFALALTSAWLWVALVGYVAGFVAWMVILRQSDLSRAFPASAVVFVAVILASWLVLRESIGGLQIAGCTVIVAGILQLGRARPAAAAPHHAPTE